MKIALYSILFIFSLQLQAAVFTDKLRELGAKCEQDIVTSCILSKGVFGYPNKTIFVFKQDNQKKNLIFYFHGHSFGKLSSGEDFDSTPQKMIRSFKFDKAMDKLNSSILVIPYTIKKCQDYDQYLASPQNFKSYIEKIQNITNKKLSLHLSAHSGAGRTLAKVINQIKTKINSISLFDALYNPPLSPSFTQWVQLENKTLNLIALANKVSLDLSQITGPTPLIESKSVYLNFNGDQKDSIMSEFSNIQDEKKYLYSQHKKSPSSQVTFYYQEKNNFIDHWYLVRDHFLFVMKENVKK